MEEGECITQKDGEESEEKKQSELEPSVERVIEDKFDASMSKVQNFFEQKFKDMGKILELEKQLAENK